MEPSREDQTVRLKIPARADYVGLARLALAALCALTSLGPGDVADLKLAVSEAANDLLAPRPSDADPTAPAGSLRFELELVASRLTLRVEADQPRPEVAEERELSRAIIEATVDEWHYEACVTRLVKYL